MPTVLLAMTAGPLIYRQCGFLSGVEEYDDVACRWSPHCAMIVGFSMVAHGNDAQKLVAIFALGLSAMALYREYFIAIADGDDDAHFRRPAKMPFLIAALYLPCHRLSHFDFIKPLLITLRSRPHFRESSTAFRRRLLPAPCKRRLMPLDA